MSSDTGLQFLRDLQRLLEEGEFVATYKFALLQALADLSVEHDAAFGGTLNVSLEQIAEKFIEYYWRQAVPYRAAGESADASLIKQNSGRQAAIVSKVAAARVTYNGSLGAACRDREGWQKLVRQVARIVEQMPLWKLQTVGGDRHEFLYRKDDFDGRRIRLLPGVPAALRAFHGLVTNLIQGGWLTQIRRIGANQSLLGESGDLSEFLFGSERQNLGAYRVILKEHQRSRCLYCGNEVKGSGEADHFIPWSRYPIDLGHNFVFSHSACNNSKRDFLAHSDHLAKWRESNLDAGEQLSKAFDAAGLVHDIERSAMIARWAYEQGENTGSHVWLTKGQIERIDDRWRHALQPMAGVAE